MFDSTVLDVVIGLIFVYLIFSLFCSAIVEWIARWTELRAAKLREGIDALLQDPAGGALITAFHSHPLITALKLDKTDYPSYIPARTFAQALYDVAFTHTPSTRGPANQPMPATAALAVGVATGPAARVLEALRKGAETDVAALQARLERWFDDSMERVSGAYKRQTQLRIVVVATVVTLGLNVDTVRVASALQNDPALRTALATRATTVVAQADSIGDIAWRHHLDTLRVSLPIGWKPCVSGRWVWQCEDFSLAAWPLGLLLTIIALSLGAPFWFDTLNKLANLRQTGVPPDERRGLEPRGTTP